jgi:hypothetical protein
LLNCKKVCKGGSFLVLGFGFCLFVLLDLQLMVVSLISSLSI